jgi:hypothetical protein
MLFPTTHNRQINIFSICLVVFSCLFSQQSGVSVRIHQICVLSGVKTNPIVVGGVSKTSREKEKYNLKLKRTMAGYNTAVSR